MPYTPVQSNTFKEIRLDTCANKISVMSTHQCPEYLKRSSLPRTVSPPPRKKIRGMCRTMKIFGEAKVQIPFRDLVIIVDVDFLLLEDPVLSSLSMKDMIQDGFDLLIQERHISFGERRQNLGLKNFSSSTTGKLTTNPTYSTPSQSFSVSIKLSVIHQFNRLESCYTVQPANRYINPRQTPSSTFRTNAKHMPKTRPPRGGST